MDKKFDLAAGQAALYGYDKFTNAQPTATSYIGDVLKEDLDSATRGQLQRAIDFLKNGNMFAARSEVDAVLLSSGSLNFEPRLRLESALKLMTPDSKPAFDLQKAQAALWGYRQ